MQKFTRNLSIIVLIALVGCAANTSRQIGDTETLAGLKAMAYTKRSGVRATAMTTSKIRETALRETALSLGAQAALAWRAKYIDDNLVKQTRHLDTIYDFNAITLEHNVLPPVLLEGRHTLNLADAQTIRISDRTYKVYKQARFITTTPNWRQYLWMDYQRPEYPHVSLLPATRDEREIWCYYVEKGWQKGTEQANTIFEDNIARIKEDFKGMILYRKLLAMNMVSPPYVSNTDLGVTGDGEEIHIDDRVLRITALPALNVNSDEWRAAVAHDETSLAELNLLEKRIYESKVALSNKGWQPVISPVN